MSKFQNNASDLCPCGSQQPYTSCCQVFLTGTAIAPTAEALMRSRYVAYGQGNVDYLISTRHVSTRRSGDRIALLESVQSTTWLSLKVLNTWQGRRHDQSGYVEFIAVYRQSIVGQLHERSRFVRENKRWFYVDGDILPPILPKRSHLCWCGSGKKFKHCHG